MAVKRAKKLTDQERNNVKIIEGRYSYINDEKIKLARYKVEQNKKLIASSVSSEVNEEILLEIAKFELYINRQVEHIIGFTAETENQNKALADSLQNKYGEGTINPSKGTFVPK